MHTLLKRLLAFALPMNIVDGDGGGGAGGSAMSTDSFAEMLGGGDDNEQTDQSDSQNVDGDQDAGEETDQPDGNEAGDDAQDGADDSGEAGDDGQAEQPEKDSAAAFLELEINGEKVKVTADEAKNGYLRQQDYTQKAQRLSQERQEWNAHVARQAAEVQQFSHELGQLQNIDAGIAYYQREVDWEQLRAEDPVSYAAHMADYQSMRQQRGDLERAIVQKQQSLTAAQAQAQQQALAQQTQEAQAHMAAIVPGFGKEHIAEMRTYGQKLGFTAQELAQVGDKRMLEVLYKASQFDKQQATKQQAIKKVAALPTKAAKAAPAAKPAAQLNIDKQTRRLQQTGSVKDLAALLSMTS